MPVKALSSMMPGSASAKLCSAVSSDALSGGPELSESALSRGGTSARATEDHLRICFQSVLLPPSESARALRALRAFDSLQTCARARTCRCRQAITHSQAGGSQGERRRTASVASGKLAVSIPS